MARKPKKDTQEDIPTGEFEALPSLNWEQVKERESKQLAKAPAAREQGRTCPTCHTIKKGNRCEVCGHQEHHT